ncbi:MAG: serine/threonine protein kinase [Deltaproteobacteria bacterium]|nr:serine/threonine protein kinase [Deltaproteobacteria bacterium]
MKAFTEGTVIAGKYRLERLIARGGMGEVWHAQHLQLDAPVAIKFMDERLVVADAARARFAREARAAASIQSPNVVHISDHGMDGGAPYIVMEMLKGEDLDTRLLRGPLSMAEAKDVMVQAARGLRKAHQMGIVHRDLKPSNLFLVPDDDELVVKIVDFGVAKAIEDPELPPMPPSRPSASALTQVGVVLGSPQYMSPEQARRFKDVDHRADVWALASIMFRAVSGKRMFGKADGMEALTRLVYEPLPVPSKLAPEMPAPIQALFDRALHPEFERRFDSARDLADAFVEAVERVEKEADLSSIAGTAVPAPVPSVPGSLPGTPSFPQGVARPSRLPTVAVAAALGLLAGGTVLVTMLVTAADSDPLMELRAVGVPRDIAVRTTDEPQTGPAEVETNVVPEDDEEFDAGEPDAAASASTKPPERPRRRWGF